MEINEAYLYEESSDSDVDLLESSSTLSSYSTSESNDEVITKKAKVESYLEVIHKYSDLQFKQHFRIARNVAGRLIELFEEYNQKDNAHGRPEVGPDREIYLTLWYLANTETYRQISDRFDVTKSSLYRILHRVIHWIITNGHNYVKWPTASEMIINQEKFYSMKNFPRVVGAIDGTHIQINCPRRNKEAYYNRKGFYSILLQAIVGPEKTFLDLHCGEPGSMHDGRLFRKSPFYHHQVNNNNNLVIPGGILLGDSAYPETSYLVTPYKDYGALTSKQRAFYYLLSSTRIVVENAFGLLKQRFRRLKFFESPDIAFISNCVVAACILHNICILENDLDELPENENHEIENESEIRESVYQDTSSIREQIFLELDMQNLLQLV